MAFTECGHVRFRAALNRGRGHPNPASAIVGSACRGARNEGGGAFIPLTGVLAGRALGSMDSATALTNYVRAEPHGVDAPDHRSSDALFMHEWQPQIK